MERAALVRSLTKRKRDNRGPISYNAKARSSPKTAIRGFRTVFMHGFGSGSLQMF